MKGKIINALLLLSSLFGYLEWGKGTSAFLFQAEYEVLKIGFTHPQSVSHPFTLIPLLGQFLLLVSLFRKAPSKTLSYIGIGCIGVLLACMVFIGLFSMNMKIVISTLPFLITSGFAIKHYSRKTPKK